MRTLENRGLRTTSTAPRKGLENERLASFLLSRFGFIVHPASVSENLGSEFFCTLFPKDMAEWRNDGGFSVDASVRIEADDLPGVERLLPNCARCIAARVYPYRWNPADLLTYDTVRQPYGAVAGLTQYE